MIVFFLKYFHSAVRSHKSLLSSCEGRKRKPTDIHSGLKVMCATNKGCHVIAESAALEITDMLLGSESLNKWFTPKKKGKKQNIRSSSAQPRAEGTSGGHRLLNRTFQGLIEELNKDNATCLTLTHYLKQPPLQS